MPRLVKISEEDRINFCRKKNYLDNLFKDEKSSKQSLINPNISVPLYNEFTIDKSKYNNFQDIDNDELLRRNVDNLLDCW
jgi:hypothetical protein